MLVNNCYTIINLLDYLVSPLVYHSLCSTTVHLSIAGDCFIGVYYLTAAIPCDI